MALSPHIDQDRLLRSKNDREEGEQDAEIPACGNDPVSVGHLVPREALDYGGEHHGCLLVPSATLNSSVQQRAQHSRYGAPAMLGPDSSTYGDLCIVGLLCFCEEPLLHQLRDLIIVICREDVHQRRSCFALV